MQRTGHVWAVIGESGFSLIEVMISILIVTVLVTGVMGYQYRSSHDARLSEIQTGAARLSMALLEGWKGTGGGPTFDPVSTFSEMEIVGVLAGPPPSDDTGGASLTVLDHYAVRFEGAYYYVTLSRAEAAAQQPRLLNIVTAWRRDYTQGSLTGDESVVRYSAFTVD
jgi:prepilin-type N-terminal cleavage/methylation domain-containing protein